MIYVSYRAGFLKIVEQIEPGDERFRLNVVLLSLAIAVFSKLYFEKHCRTISQEN